MADSGDSSPLSAAATDDAHHDNASDLAAAVTAPQSSLPPPPPPPSRVRLMVSYGGRIQPRPHDNQLAYVNGETKILSLERTAAPLRFPDFAARLAALANSASPRADALCVKYQLPGEDLDALVTVANDEDLEHLLVEYDRLHLFRAPAPTTGSGGGGVSSLSRSATTTTPRLRVFLFPLTPPPEQQQQPKQQEQQQQHRDWYLDLRSASPTPQQQQQQPQVQSPPPHAVPMAAVPQSMMVPKTLDFLFGLDCASFVPPPAVKVKDPSAEPPAAIRDNNVPVEIPTKANEDRVPNPNPAAAAADNAMLAPAVSPTEFHRQIHDKLQLADNNNATQQQQPPPQAPAPVVAQQPPPQAPAPVAAQQPPPQAPAPVAAQQSPSSPAPVVAQQSPPAPAPVVPAAQVLPRNGSDDSLTRAYPPAATTSPPEYYVPKFQEKPQAAAHPSSAPFLPVPGRYASVAPGSGADHGPFFFIPAPPHGYYASTNPNGTSYYAVAPHNGNGNGNGTATAPSMSNTPAYPQVAYDSNGRAVYYTGLLPQYPSAVNGMSSAAAVLGSEPSKPVPVKPTVS